MSDAAARVWRQRQLLGLLAGIFLAPLALSFYLHYGHGGWRPDGTVNHGELITPPRPLPAVALSAADGSDSSAQLLRGKWTLIYLGDGACDARCRQALYVTRQVRLALNQDRDRVQRVFLYQGDCCEEPYFSTEHHGLISLDLDSDGGRRLAELFRFTAGRPVESGRLWLADPLGNLMMSYPANADPKGMIEDLKRLLRLSHVG
jgi:cytochrome oxidase Cu insertion factor (SCO1/SenC/PrrC family)